MKKLLVVLLAVCMLFAFAACSSGEKEAAEPKSYELALVTDVGTIDDKSFNQGAWEGLKKYADEHSIPYKYYQPTEQTDAAYLDGINLAIQGGAKLVVCPGFLFGPAVTEAAKVNPEINFIIIDTSPSEDCANVYSIYYAEEQSGFLAGYAAVKDGYTNLGFMGGMAVPAVIAYGTGFVQGVDAAAKELGVEASVRYNYTGSFAATPEIQTNAGAWYTDGVECIFACGGGIWSSVAAAAEAAGAKMIGVDNDQNSFSETMLTTACKDISGSVYNGIAASYAGTFPGGEIATLGADKGGVKLPMGTSRFAVFTQADYDAVFGQMVDGSLVVKRITDASVDVTAIEGCDTVKVTLIQ